MRQKLFTLLTACTLALVSAACSGAGDSNNNTTTPAASASPATANNSPAAPTAQGQGAPGADVVRASASGATTVRAGGNTEASVRVEIANGYHVNANPPTHAYLIPTELTLASEQGVTAGAPVYPAPLTKKFSFDPQPLKVYEGQATIRLPLGASADATKGERVLRARVRAQPCDDKACYPPRNVEVSIPLTIN